MEVKLSSEQEAFAKSSVKLAAELGSAWDQGRGPADVMAPLSSADVWQRVVDAGWLAVRVDESAGGGGGECMDVCVLVEQLGRHSLSVPVIGAIIALEQLQLNGAPDELLASIISGERRVAPLFTADLRDFATATEDAIAVDAAGADTAFVLGERPGEVTLGPSEPTGDLTRSAARPVGDVRPLDFAPRTDEIRQRELAYTLTVLSADLLGLMATALDQSVSHARIREQFGHPIGSFQAVAHLLAEAHVSLEATRSAVWYAAWGVDHLDPAEALHAARTAKAFASARGVEVVEAAIQTFGGLGMTWESRAHVWQRRTHLDRRLLGDEFAQYSALSTIDRRHHGLHR